MEKVELLEKIKSKIKLKTNKSPILLFFRILFAILFVDIVVILVISFFDLVNIEEKGFFSMYSFEENIFLLALFFHLFFFVYLFVYWLFEFYIIGENKVVYERGILFKKKNIFIIEEINTIEVSQSFFGRIFDYGNIVLFYHEKEFILRNIPHPKEFVNFIEVFRIK